MPPASGKKNDRASTKRGDGDMASDMLCKCGRLLQRCLTLSKTSAGGGGGVKQEEPLPALSSTKLSGVYALNIKLITNTLLLEWSWFRDRELF
jgi:hypothetical protein